MQSELTVDVASIFAEFTFLEQNGQEGSQCTQATTLCLLHLHGSVFLGFICIAIIHFVAVGEKRAEVKAANPDDKIGDIAKVAACSVVVFNFTLVLAIVFSVVITGVVKSHFAEVAVERV